LSYLLNGDTFGFLIDDEDILSGYRVNTTARRPQYDVDDDEDELSDYVKTRLLIARLLALKKYDEVHGSLNIGA
jgi:hypothetical protein